MAIIFYVFNSVLIQLLWSFNYILVIYLFVSDKAIDWKTVDLKKMRVKQLKKILDEWGEVGVFFANSSFNLFWLVS